VDVALAQRRHKVAIKGVTIALGVLLLLMVSNYLLDKFFGLDPIQKQARLHTTQAERYLLSGDYADAIAEYEQAVAVYPSDGQPRIQLGVLYGMEGRTEEAQAALAAAEAAIGDRADYLVVLSRAYQGLGDPEAAVAAVQEAIELKPDFALAYMIRGGLHEQMGETPKALDDYESAAQLAREQGNDQLYVVARVRLAMGLQRPPSIGGPGAGF
jgi:tetratricopeptide (TPR) repeat protein